MNVSAGSVTTVPGTTDTGEPTSWLLPVDVEPTVALFPLLCVVTLIWSPSAPFTHCFTSVRFRFTRVFVYVHTTFPSGITKVVFGPGVELDAVAPVHDTVVV